MNGSWKVINLHVLVFMAGLNVDALKKNKEKRGEIVQSNVFMQKQTS